MLRNTTLPLLLTAVAALPLWPTPESTALAAEAGPDQGLVVFHRAGDFGGRAIRFNLEQNGVPVGQLLAGTTIQLPLAPGTYVFSVRAPSLDGLDSITINVEAGRTYTVEGEILWGWPTGRPKFGPVSESGAPVAPASPPAATPTTPTNALAGAALGSTDPGPSAGVTAVDRGRIGFRNFIGDWDLEMWSLDTDGNKQEGRGLATGTAEGENATRIIITEFQADAFPAATGGGQILFSYEPEKGFFLVSNFKHSGEVLRFTGQYQSDTGLYVFYLFGAPAGQIATGIVRSSVRVEVRSLDTASWVADTFSSVSGQTINVQSYRFTRR